MLKGIFIVFLFQLFGEFVQKFFLLTLPGPVLGLIFLLITLLLFKKQKYFSHIFDSKLMIVSENLISYLPLLFVPIGVGVVMHLSFLRESIFPLLIIIFFSTLLTILVTALIMGNLAKKK